MKLLSTLTLAALATLTLPATASAQDADTVTGVARCETDGWSVDWTISVPSRGGQWSITPGMYQNPRPWQSDTEPFTWTTTGHSDQPDATVGITYGWVDGPTGQWAVGTVANPECATAEPVAAVAVTEPVHAVAAIVEPVVVTWLTPAELFLGDLRAAR